MEYKMFVYIFIVLVAGAYVAGCWAHIKCFEALDELGKLGKGPK